ncbi:MAG: hypothetical protein K5985_09895 [Lachnospiraceae bacterium]|nr:hypothetical protein [Lachnospiraceae bacterium]
MASFMLLRSLIMIEGVIEELCPRLNLFELLSTKFVDRAKKNFDLKKEILKVGEDVLSLGKKAARIPALCADALKDIVKGNTKINLELTGYEELEHSIGEMVRNVIYAVFACVMFYGSCLLCATEIEPKAENGMPLLAIAGFLFSIALGIYSVKRMSKK